MGPEENLEDHPEYGPFLLAALFCEMALEEKDGVISAIRIVDRINSTAIGPEPPSVMEPFDHELHLLIQLKTGQNPGPCLIEIKARKPDLTPLPPFSRTILLESPEQKGMNLIAKIRFKFDQVGVWKFDVYIRGKWRTQIPLDIRYLPQPTLPTPLPS